MPAPGVGKRQRLAQLNLDLQAARNASLFECDMVSELVKAWANTEMPAVKVQFWAHQCYLTLKVVLESLGQNTRHIPEALRALAELGRWGRNPQNCARDLREYLGQPSSVPPPEFVDLHVKVLKPFPRISQEPMPFYFPHLVIAHMFSTDRQQFDEFMLRGNPNELEKFWSEIEARKDPRLDDHPMKRRPEWKYKAVPILIHGDDVPVVKVGKPGTASLHNSSWQPLFARGRSLFLKRLIFAMFNSNCVDETQPRMWHLIAWSLQWLYRGIHPDKDWDDNVWPVGSSQRLLGENKEPLAGGFFFPVWGLQQDLDWSLKCYKMRSYNSNEPCDFCPCSKTSPDPKMIPTYFGKDATWMTLQYTPKQWRRQNPDMMELFKVFAFLSSLNLEPDEMHILYLGVYQYHCGSILWLLVYRLMPNTAAENMRALWTDILEEYQSGSPCKQFTSLVLGSFTRADRPRKDYPRLKGSASEIKWLIGPLKAVWVKYKRPGNRYDNRVLASLNSILAIQDLIDESSHDMFMDIPKVIELRQQIADFLNHLVWLANEVDRPVPNPASLFQPGDKLFTVPPKSHWMWHLGWRAMWLSPRRGACYAGEDLQRLLKGIARSCTANCPSHLIPRTMALKYRWAVHFENIRAKHSH